MAAHPAISDSLEKHYLPLHLAISRQNLPLFRAWDSHQLKHGVPGILILDPEGKILTTTPANVFTASAGEFSEPKIIEFLGQWAPKPLTRPATPALTPPPAFITASFFSHNIGFVNIHIC